MCSWRSVQSTLLTFGNGNVLASLVLSRWWPELPLPMSAPMYTDVFPTGQQWHKPFHSSLHSTVEVVCVTVYVVNTLSPSSLVKKTIRFSLLKKSPWTSRCFLADSYRWGMTVLLLRAAGWWKSSTSLCPPKVSCITLFVSAGWPETKVTDSPHESSTSWMLTVLTLASR